MTIILLGFCFCDNNTAGFLWLAAPSLSGLIDLISGIIAANQPAGSQPASWDSQFRRVVFLSFFFRFWSINSCLKRPFYWKQAELFSRPCLLALTGTVSRDFYSLPHQICSLNLVPWLSLCWIIFEYGLNFADIFVTCFWLRGIYNIYSKMLLNLCSPSSVLHYFLYSFLCDYPFKSHPKASLCELTPKTWTLQKHRIKKWHISCPLYIKEE